MCTMFKAHNISDSGRKVCEFLYIHLCRKNGTEKWHNKLISCRHLLRPHFILSESKRTENSKDLFSREWSNSSIRNSTLKPLNMVYTLFLSCGNNYHSLFRAQIVQRPVKNVLLEASLVPAGKTSNTKL